MQLTSYALQKIATELIAASAIFDPTKVFLGVATAIVPSGINTAISAITPAPGSLAPLQEITNWGTPYLAKNNLEVVDSGIHTFSPTTPTDAATIVGWYIMDAASAGNLIGFGFLTVPVTLAGPQNQLSIVLRISVDPSGTWDVSMDWDD